MRCVAGPTRSSHVEHIFTAFFGPVLPRFCNRDAHRIGHFSDKGECISSYHTPQAKNSQNLWCDHRFGTSEPILIWTKMSKLWWQFIWYFRGWIVGNFQFVQICLHKIQALPPKRFLSCPKFPWLQYFTMIDVWPWPKKTHTKIHLKPGIRGYAACWYHPVIFTSHAFSRNISPHFVELSNYQ